MKRILIIFSILLNLFGCYDFIGNASDELIVEGWIESGGFPKVQVLKMVKVSRKYQAISDLDKYLVKYAQVWVSEEGGEKVRLMGVFDKDAPLGFYYTTYELRGKENKRYFLEIVYDNKVLKAQTIIPSSVVMDSVKIVKEGERNVLEAYFEDPKEEKNFYCFFTKRGKSKFFFPAILSVTSDSLGGFEKGYRFNLGTSNLKAKETEKPLLLTDTVEVKLLNLTQEGYTFWREYSKQKAFSLLPGGTNIVELRGNIEGVKGYWFGYGVSVKKTNNSF